MNWKFLTPKIHGLLDYAAAGGLIVLPFLLDLGSASALALWFSVVAGIGLIVYSLLTDYEFGVFRLVSFKSHLWLDGLAAVAFIIAPFVFGWSGLVMAYYIVMGLGVVAVIGFSAADEQPAHATTAT